MERWLYIVETNCSDPSREKEYNDWYDKVHLPDILETPRFVRASRYENTNPGEGQGKFLAVYEIETDDIGQTMADFTEQVNSGARKGLLSDLLLIVQAGLYRQITTPMNSK